jgi:hypothetical protein
MEYTLSAEVQQTKNPNNSVTLTAIPKYDYVGNIEDVDFVSKIKQYTEVEDDITEIIDDGQDDNFNSCKLLESGSLVE